MRISLADEEMFRARDAWRYDPPYDFYDSDGLPVKNPERFFAVHDDEGVLAGFYYFEYVGAVGDTLFYGLGLRPDLTGCGLGESFVRAGLAFAREHFPALRITLDVAAFNRRAIQVYERVGFVYTGRHLEPIDGHGSVDFLDMELVVGGAPVGGVPTGGEPADG